eukprot:5046893-Prymnesium_polylepis.1
MSTARVRDALHADETTWKLWCEKGRFSVARVQRTPFSANRNGMASRGLWGAGAGKRSEGCCSRELCDCEANQNGMETDHLHAIFDSPLVRAAHSLRLSIAASAAEPVAGGQP